MHEEDWDEDIDPRDVITVILEEFSKEQLIYIARILDNIYRLVSDTEETAKEEGKYIGFEFVRDFMRQCKKGSKYGDQLPDIPDTLEEVQNNL